MHMFFFFFYQRLRFGKPCFKCNKLHQNQINWFILIALNYRIKPYWSKFMLLLIFIEYPMSIFLLALTLSVHRHDTGTGISPLFTIWLCHIDLYALCFVSQNMISSFRVSELQVLLGFAGRNKSGRKHELLLRALHLLKSDCIPAVQLKIKDLYRRRYPRTLDGLAELTALKSSIDSYLHSEEGSTVVSPNLSPAVSPSDSARNVVPVKSAVFHDSKPRMNMQQPTPLMPPVHPDVQMKSLPFYDVLDVLIKPSSLGSCGCLFKKKFFKELGQILHSLFANAFQLMDAWTFYLKRSVKFIYLSLIIHPLHFFLII